VLRSGFNVIHLDSPLDLEVVTSNPPDIVLSFGYKHVIPKRMLEKLGNRAYNVHVSLLPWNRGMHPNFWSWLENTPKGVSIHRISENLDEGDLVAQKELELSESATLFTSYQQLLAEAQGLLAKNWMSMVQGTVELVKQDLTTGSFHRGSELEQYWPLLGKGWQTSCGEVAEIGRAQGLWR